MRPLSFYWRAMPMLCHNPIVLQKLISIKAWLNIAENYGVQDRNTFEDALKNINMIVNELLHSEHRLSWRQGVPTKPGIYYFSPTKQDVDIPMLVGVSTINGGREKSITVRHFQAYDFDPFIFPGVENFCIKAITQIIDTKKDEVYYSINEDTSKFYSSKIHPLSACWFAGPIERPPTNVN